jgi:hypothetical protein
MAGGVYLIVGRFAVFIALSLFFGIDLAVLCVICLF